MSDEQLKSTLVIEDKMTPSLKAATAAATGLDVAGKKLNDSVKAVSVSFHNAKSVGDLFKATINKLTGAFHKMGKENKKAGKEGKEGFFGAFLSVEILKKGLELAKRGVEFLTKSVERLREKGIELEEISSVFEMKGGEKGLKVMTHMKDFLEQVGINGDDAMYSIKQLGQAFDPESAEELSRIIADIKGNMPTANVKELVDQFVKLGPKALASEKDVRKLSIASGTTVEQMAQGIAKATGKALPLVEAGLKKGTITTLELVQGLRQAQFTMADVGHSGEAAAKELANSFEAQLNRVNSAFDNMQEEIAKALTSPEAAAALKELGDELFKIAEDPAFKHFLAEVGKDLAQFSQGHVKEAIAAFELITKAFEKWDASKSIVTNLGNALAGTFGIASGQGKMIVQSIADVGTGVIAVFKAIIWVTIQLCSVFVDLVEAFAWLTLAPGKFGEAIGKWILKIPQLGKDMVMGLVDGIESFAQHPIDAITDIGKKSIAAFKSLLGIHSPSKVMMELGVNTSEGFAEGIDDGSRDVVRASSGVASIPAVAASGAASGGGGRGSGATVTVSFGDIIVGGASGQSARDVADDIMTQVERRLVDIFSASTLQG